MMRPEAEPDPLPNGNGENGENAVDSGDWPHFLEKYLLPGEALGEAYEATPPERRALIKSSLALAQLFHSRFAGPGGFAEQKMECTGSDYGLLSRRSPAPWAILVLGPGSCSAVRLAAAIMPAHLAGVPDIAAVWLQEQHASPTDIPQALLAALELAGVERIFSLPAHLPQSLAPHLASAPLSQAVHSSPHPLAALLKHMVRSRGCGRLLLFPGADTQNTSHLAKGLNIPVWEDSPPRFVLAAPGVRLDMEALAWAHPEAQMLPPVAKENEPASGSQVEKKPDVFYGTPEDFARFRTSPAGQQSSPLVLAPGLEGLWFHPNLPSDFFVNVETAVYRRDTTQDSR